MKRLVAVFEHCGGKPGRSKARVQALLDPSATGQRVSEEAVAAAIETVKQKAQDEYMGIALILKSDPKRYGQLVRNIQNDHTRGLGGYPKTLTDAYDILVNYKVASSRQWNYEPEMTFAQTDDQTPNNREQP